MTCRFAAGHISSAKCNDTPRSFQGQPKKHRSILEAGCSMMGKPGTRVSSCRINDGVREKGFESSDGEQVP